MPRKQPGPIPEGDGMTIHDIALRCVTYAGRNEEDIVADFERRCRRLQILPLNGQLLTALRALMRAGKVRFIHRDGHKLLQRAFTAAD
jgi:hypothetical protein